MMIEVLAGVPSGATIGPAVGDRYELLDQPQGVGSFLHLIDVSAFLPQEQFISHIEGFIDAIKATGSPKIGHELLVPGGIETRTAAARSQQGIPLSPDVTEALERVAPQGLAVPVGTPA